MAWAGTALFSSGKVVNGRCSNGIAEKRRALFGMGMVQTVQRGKAGATS